jgi:anthranilate/para-aminobenzoate synthase component I
MTDRLAKIAVRAQQASTADDTPSPLAAFDAVAGRAGVAFLHGGGFAEHGRSVLAWDPVSRLEIAVDGRPSIAGRCGDPLDAIDRFVSVETERGRTVIGALSYDLRRWIEPLAGGPARGTLPLAVLHAYDAFAVHDPTSDRWSGAAPPHGAVPASPARLRDLAPTIDGRTYRRRFDRLRRALVDGELYQANLAIPFEGTLDGSPAGLFAALAAVHPVPYGAYLDCGPFRILSNSPELLFHRLGDAIETRPIKGTRPRGSTAATDARRIAELQASPKERAEHVMIVDLERNDLGRLAVAGSVGVEDLARVASYGTLHHLESTIRARLRPDVGLADLLRAVFPGGSVTGAPKIRAMHCIDELESAPREFYTGSIVFAPPDGELVANVAIRCAIARDDRIRYFAGGGIVIDSIVDEEWDECLLKAKAWIDAGARPR